MGGAVRNTVVSATDRLRRDTTLPLKYDIPDADTCLKIDRVNPLITGSMKALVGSLLTQPMPDTCLEIDWVNPFVTGLMKAFIGS